MSLESAIQNRSTLLYELGKTALNIRYPNEFELYLCALELVDEEGKTLRYFVFPVMPSGISETKPQLTNIKKTLAGVTVLSSPTFMPTDITLSGNFGRKFKVLLGTDLQDFASSFTVNNQITANSVISGVGQFFDARIKTGYGCIKILEEIINQSNQIDSGGIKRLIFYNQALGNSYLVKATSLTFNQSQESNMIWNYNLQLKSIAPLESIKTSKEIQDQNFRLDTTGFAQKQLNNLVNSISNMIGGTEAILATKILLKWPQQQ